MKQIITTMMLAVSGIVAYSQPTLVSGFNGMASVNGTTYSKIGTVGDPTGGYAFVCASNDRTRFYASSFLKQYLYFVDPATFAVTDSMHHIIYTIVASNEPNTIFARTDSGMCRINAATKTITDSVDIPTPAFVKERPNSKEVWVTSDNKVYVVDYTSGLSATPFTVSSVSTDNGEMTFTSGGTLAYKVAWTSKRVYKINAATKTVVDSVSTGTSSPSSLVLSADSSRLFVTFPTDFKVRIYATASMTIVDSINCGTREPFEIYRHPDRSEIWVVNHFKDSITVFNESTYTQIATFGVSSSPHSLAFGIGTTAIHDQPSANTQIAIMPNPASNILTIKGIKPGYIISIYNTTGQQVMSTTGVNNTGNLNISSLMAGLYIVQITDEKGITKLATQLVKQ